MKENQFPFITDYLSGKSVKRIAKIAKCSPNHVYVKIGKEIITINTMLNLNLGLKCGDIFASPQIYADAIFKISGVKPAIKLSPAGRRGTSVSQTQINVATDSKVTSPVELLLEAMQPEYRKGAVIMFNFLKSYYERE